jgi:hypothetical protein
MKKPKQKLEQKLEIPEGLLEQVKGKIYKFEYVSGFYKQGRFEM